MLTGTSGSAEDVSRQCKFCFSAQSLYEVADAFPFPFSLSLPTLSSTVLSSFCARTLWKRRTRYDRGCVALQLRFLLQCYCFFSDCRTSCFQPTDPPCLPLCIPLCPSLPGWHIWPRCHSCTVAHAHQPDSPRLLQRDYQGPF